MRKDSLLEEYDGVPDNETKVYHRKCYQTYTHKKHCKNCSYLTTFTSKMKLAEELV